MKRIALGGATQAVLNIAAFGPTYDSRFLGDDGPVFRRGGLLTLQLREREGIALGRNLVVKDRSNFNAPLRFHEYTHYLQQRELGFGGFYGRILSEYYQAIRVHGAWNYTYRTPGHLEYQSTELEDLYKFYLRLPR